MVSQAARVKGGFRKNVLIGLQDMYRTPWLWQWGKLHLPISFYTRRICVLQGNIGRQCWGLFLLTSPEHAFVFAFHILLVFVYVFCIWLMRIRPQYLMTMLTMFWFVFYVFFLLCFHHSFCGSHLFHRSQHCPMGIVAINPAKQKYRLWEKCSKPSCQVCLLIRIPRKCPPTQLGRWWGDERVLGI